MSDTDLLRSPSPSSSSSSSSSPLCTDNPEEWPEEAIDTDNLPVAKLPNLRGANFPAVVSQCDAVIFAFAHIAEVVHTAKGREGTIGAGANASSTAFPLPPLWPMVMAAGARQWVVTPSHVLKVMQRFGGRLTEIEIEMPPIPPYADFSHFESRLHEAILRSCGDCAFESVRALRCDWLGYPAVAMPQLEELWCSRDVTWESLLATPLPRLRSVQPGFIRLSIPDVPLDALTTVYLDEYWEAEHLSALLRKAPNVTRLGMQRMDLDTLSEVFESSSVWPQLRHLTVGSSNNLSVYLPQLPRLESLRATTCTDCVATVVARLPALRRLWLRCESIWDDCLRATKIGDLAFVSQLQSLSLEWDTLAESPDWTTLPSTVSSLEHLQLSGRSAAEIGARLVHAGLRTFDIDDQSCENWSDALRTLTSHGPQLRRLRLVGRCLMGPHLRENDDLLEVLGSCGAALRFLMLFSRPQCPFLVDSLDAMKVWWDVLGASCPHLETLHVGLWVPCGARSIVTLLGHCRGLESVTVHFLRDREKRTVRLLRQMTARRKLVLRLVVPWPVGIRKFTLHNGRNQAIDEKRFEYDLCGRPT